jgi:hypothetical protein
MQDSSNILVHLAIGYLVNIILITIIMKMQQTQATFFLKCANDNQQLHFGDRA